MGPRGEQREKSARRSGTLSAPKGAPGSGVALLVHYEARGGAEEAGGCEGAEEGSLRQDGQGRQFPHLFRPARREGRGLVDCAATIYRIGSGQHSSVAVQRDGTQLLQ